MTDPPRHLGQEEKFRPVHKISTPRRQHVGDDVGASGPAPSLCSPGLGSRTHDTGGVQNSSQNDAISWCEVSNISRSLGAPQRHSRACFLSAALSSPDRFCRLTPAAPTLGSPTLRPIFARCPFPRGLLCTTEDIRNTGFRSQRLTSTSDFR